MNEDKKRILDMLAEGKLTPDEAMLLMDQLEDKTATPAPPVFRPEAPAPAPQKAGREKMFRVLVNVNNDEMRKPMNVNINLPLKAARIAGDIVTRVMPEQARDALEDEGIDLTALDIGALIDALEETGGDIVNITHDGDEDQVTVRVYIE